MANYQEFRKKSLRRRMKKIALASAVVLFCMCVLAGLLWLMLSGLGMTPVRSAAKTVRAEKILPGLAVTAEAAGTAQEWNTVNYANRTLDYTVLGQDDGTTAMDYRLAALPACGRITKEYYNYVTFMGDSLTQGLEIYEKGLPNASYCAYRGVGPSAVVNGATCRRSDGTKEIPLEALSQMAPEAIYVLFGTNVLTNASDAAQASFLAYYDQMIDLIKQTRPGIRIYMQSITPVRPEIAAEKPGLNKARLQRINDELAAMAIQKGCYFIDLWEPLADENGDLKAEIAQPDGYHVTPDGYAMWVEYLRTHTAYKPGALYEPGSGSWYIPA